MFCLFFFFFFGGGSSFRRWPEASLTARRGSGDPGKEPARVDSPRPGQWPPGSEAPKPGLGVESPPTTHPSLEAGHGKTRTSRACLLIVVMWIWLGLFSICELMPANTSILVLTKQTNKRSSCVVQPEARHRFGHNPSPKCQHNKTRCVIKFALTGPDAGVNVEAS